MASAGQARVKAVQTWEFLCITPMQTLTGPSDYSYFDNSPGGIPSPQKQKQRPPCISNTGFRKYSKTKICILGRGASVQGEGLLISETFSCTETGCRERPLPVRAPHGNFLLPLSCSHIQVLGKALRSMIIIQYNVWGAYSPSNSRTFEPSLRSLPCSKVLRSPWFDSDSWRFPLHEAAALEGSPRCKDDF